MAQSSLRVRRGPMAARGAAQREGCKLRGAVRRCLAVCALLAITVLATQPAWVAPRNLHRQPRQASALVLAAEESGLPNLDEMKAGDFSKAGAPKEEEKKAPKGGPERTPEDRTFNNPVIRIALAVSAGLILNVFVRTQLGM
mmetsp:Transcript_96414/g.208055  ORF Transcript_96414/g.208055 Transcript_96414/m.208055 type:complete len:142 (+) Transcript_96414:1-426(+)